MPMLAQIEARTGVRPAELRGVAATALRGLDKVTGTACLFVLTYNILRFITLSA